MLGFKLLAAFAAVAPAFGRPAIPLSTRQDGLPVVDLGYELHEAFSLDVCFLTCLPLTSRLS